MTHDERMFLIELFKAEASVEYRDVLRKLLYGEADRIIEAAASPDFRDNKTASELAKMGCKLRSET